MTSPRNWFLDDDQAIGRGWKRWGDPAAARLCYTKNQCGLMVEPEHVRLERINNRGPGWVRPRKINPGWVEPLHPAVTTLCWDELDRLTSFLNEYHWEIYITLSVGFDHVFGVVDGVCYLDKWSFWEARMSSVRSWKNPHFKITE
jgi:hypothetical protein